MPVVVCLLAGRVESAISAEGGEGGELLRAVVWEGVVHGSFFAEADHELIINLCCELVTLIINYNVMNN